MKMKLEYIEDKYKVFNLPKDVLKNIYDNNHNEEEILNEIIKYLKKENLINFKVILNYLNILDFDYKDSKEISFELSNLCEFIEKTGYILEFSDCHKILNNEAINNYFNNIIKSQKTITEKEIHKLSCKNDIFELLLETFCYIHNIEIILNNEFFYDLKNIGIGVDLNVIISLLKLFPKNDYSLFIKYSGIDALKGKIKKRKNYEISKGMATYIKYIENDLRYMYLLYIKYKALKEDECTNNILHDIEKVSLRFKFKNKSYKEIKEAVKKLREDEQKELFRLHGIYLLGIKTKPSLLYESIIDNLEEVLYNGKIKKKTSVFVSTAEGTTFKNKFIACLINEYGIKRLKKAISMLSEKGLEFCLLKYGKDLKEDNKLKAPEDKNKTYYNILHKRIKKRLNTILDSLDEEVTEEIDLEKIFKNYLQREYQNIYINDLVNKHGIKKLKKAISMLSEKELEFCLLKYGKDLKEDNKLKAPEDKNTNYYYFLNASAKKRLNTILDSLDEEVTEEIDLEKIFENYNQREYQNIYINDLVNKYGIKRLKKAISMLSEKGLEFCLLKYGKDLKDNNKLKVPDNKNENYYYKFNTIVKKRLNTILDSLDEEVTEEIDLEKIFENYNQREYQNIYINDLVNEYGIKKLKKVISMLSEKELEFCLLKYGKDLKEDNKLKAPKDKNKNYYYILNANVKKRLNDILNSLNENVIKNDIKYQKLEVLKRELEKAKEVKDIVLLDTVKNKLINKFSAILENEKIEEIIINTTSNDEFYLESQIMLYLSNIYNSDPNSMYALEILEFLENTYGNNLKKRFTNENNICLISSGLVSKALEQTIINYSGSKTFTTEFNLNIRKLR